jgi:hypothetical protein
MLHIHFGHLDEEVWCVPGDFDSACKPNWIDNPISKRIIKGIDNSEVTAGRVIESPVLGQISPRELSGTTKCVISMIFASYMDGKYFCGSLIGDNAAPYILEIARTKDIYMTIVNHFKFPKDMTDKIYVENTKTIVTGYDGYMDEFRKWVRMS